MDRFALNADLINDLAKQRVVLFLGSGVSASASTNSGRKIKQWEPFLRDCAGLVDDAAAKQLAFKLIDDRDYLMACEVLRRRLDEKWTELLHDEFAQIAAPSALHHALVALDQRIVVTTNFDKLLESAFDQSGSTHHPRVISRLNAEAFKMLRDDRRYLVKLHGSIDDPDSFIFTKAEYIERAFESAIYGDFIRTLLATHTFVFVGFSMSDPAISSLVEQYAYRYPGSRPHYVLQAGPLSDDMVETNKRLRKLYAIQYDPKDNHAELADLGRAMVEKMKVRRAELAAAATKDRKREPDEVLAAEAAAVPGA